MWLHPQIAPDGTSYPAIIQNSFQAIPPCSSGVGSRPKASAKAGPLLTHPIIQKSTHPCSSRAVAPCRTRSYHKKIGWTLLRAPHRKQNMKNYQTNPFCETELSCNYNGLGKKCTKPEGKTNPFCMDLELGPTPKNIPPTRSLSSSSSSSKSGKSTTRRRTRTKPGATWHLHQRPDRGCVEDQPQHLGKERVRLVSAVWKLIELLQLAFSTAALRSVCRVAPDETPKHSNFFAASHLCASVCTAL